MGGTLYNPYNVEASFRDFLIAGNISPVSLKNYLSDFRHFAGWISANSTPSSFSSIHELITTVVTQSKLHAYKNYLLDNNYPVQTINRRLSALRKFCSFCISQGWLKENEAKKVSNAETTKTKISLIDFKSLLQQYRSHLTSTNMTEDFPVINNFLDYLSGN